MMRDVKASSSGVHLPLRSGVARGEDEADIGVSSYGAQIGAGAAAGALGADTTDANG